MKWYHVDELLPEDCPLCNFHKDGTLSFTSVLAMDRHCRMEIKNRLKVDRCGSPYLDEQATDGWIWSESNMKVEYWCPIPRNRKLLERKEKMHDVGQDI